MSRRSGIVILVSGRGSNMQAVLQAVREGLIGKPYQADELIRTIRILAAPGGSSQDAAGG